ncbi:MAG: recombinase family protein [Bdellovibrionaceae bacterium]|nr:recombinase family protein [Pseudobdellovibrionaceae bacterium]
MAGLKGLRCLIYARVSLIDMEPANQIEPLKEFALRNDMQVIAVLTDRVSGKTEDRPQLRKLIGRLKANEADIVLVAALDRLGRNLSHVLKLVKTFRDSNKGLYSVRESLDLRVGNPQSELLLHVFGALSEFEASLISMRTKEALKVAKLSGKRLGRPSKVNQELIDTVIDFHRSGVPVREIARRIPEISRASVQQILKRHKT